MIQIIAIVALALTIFILVRRLLTLSAKVTTLELRAQAMEERLDTPGQMSLWSARPPSVAIAASPHHPEAL